MSQLLLDVRLADDFEAGHLNGAINQPVFEVQFTDEILKKYPDKDCPIKIYGASANSLEAEMALEKLRRLGYQNLSILEGGIDSAVRSGNVIVTGEALPAPPPLPEGRKEVDPSESLVIWTGRNLLNSHNGTVAISEGSLDFSKGKLVGGEIILDLAQLHCLDLAGGPMHDVLIAHLHNDDFLDLPNYPTATLKICSSQEVSPHPGAPNLHISAELTIKDKTLPLQFVATTGVTPEGITAAQATFTIERTDWGIHYGSGKLFHRVAGHLVNDLIEFQVKIIAA